MMQVTSQQPQPDQDQFIIKVNGMTCLASHVPGGDIEIVAGAEGNF